MCALLVSLEFHIFFQIAIICILFLKILHAFLTTPCLSRNYNLIREANKRVAKFIWLLFSVYRICLTSFCWPTIPENFSQLKISLYSPSLFLSLSFKLMKANFLHFNCQFILYIILYGN